MCVVGLVADITVLLQLGEDLLNRTVDGKPVEYLLTYKFLQDHLEMLFACIRRSLGCNNNSSVVGFEAAFKKILFRSGVSLLPGNSANVTRQDETAMISVSSEQSVIRSESTVFKPLQFEHTDASSVVALSPFVDSVLG